MSINYVNSSKEATNGAGWTQLPDSESIGKEVENGGFKYKIVAREEHKTSVMKRVGVIALTCLTLGLVLLNDSMKSIFFGKEVDDFAVPVTQLEAERKTVLEARKDKAASISDNLAFQTAKDVVRWTGVGAVFGTAGTIGVVEGLKHFAPTAFELAGQYVSPINYIAAIGISAGAACGVVALSKKTALKDAKKVVAVGAVGVAGAMVSMAAFAEPKLAVVGSLLVGAAGTVHSIFSHFRAKGDARLAELEQTTALKAPKETVAV